jgi:choice-of-anchor C domain-containing protein
MSRFQARRRLFAAGTLMVAAMTSLGVAASTPAQALTGISNGSFESPVVTPNSFQQFATGASIGAWTVTEANVDLAGAGFWQHADGVQSLDLDGGVVTGAVSQTFTTVPLLKYKISYKLAGNTDAGPAVKTGKVLVDGGVVQNFSFDATGKSRVNMGYIGKETYFIATGLSATLTFKSTTGSGFGPVIDKVVVESCLLIICL